jgi:hypothetical protein
VIPAVDGDHVPAERGLRPIEPIDTLLESLSTTIRVRFPRPRAPAWRTASQLEPSLSSPSPVRTKTGFVEPARSQRVGDADGHRQAVAERPGRDLDTGHPTAVRMRAQDALPGHEQLELLGGENPLRAGTAY